MEDSCLSLSKSPGGEDEGCPDPEAPSTFLDFLDTLEGVGDKDIFADEPAPRLSWDDVKLPIPYRFIPEHRRIALGPSAASVFSSPPVKYLSLSSKEDSERLLEAWWKLEASESPESWTKKPEEATLQEFIRASFHLLAGRSSSLFRFDKETDSFFLRPEVYLKIMSPKGLQYRARENIRCGNIVRKIEAFIADADEGRDRKKKKGIVVRALIKYLSNFLRLYYGILMMNEGSMRVLTQLDCFIEPYRVQLEVIDKVLVELERTQDSVKLLSFLNHLVVTLVSSKASHLSIALFLTCVSAYLKHVGDWAFRGLLPQDDFQVKKATSSVYRDRRFWVKQFYQEEEDIPGFLRSSAQLILESGIAVSFINQIKSENMMSRHLFSEVDDELELSPVFNFQDLNNLNAKWDAVKLQFPAASSNLARVSKTLSKSEEIVVVKLRRPKTRAELAQEKRESQALFKEELDKQVAEAELFRKRASRNIELEEQRDVEYVKMRDKRDLEEQKRIHSKHFGEEYQPKIDRGLFSKLHGGTPVSPADAPEDAIDKQKGSGDHPDVDIPDAVPKTQDTITSLAESAAGNRESFASAQEESSESSDPGFATPPEENESNNEEASGAGDGPVVSFQALDPETPRRLNPDNLITTPPPLYSFLKDPPNFSLPSSSSKEEPVKEDSNRKIIQNPTALCMFLEQSVQVPLSVHYKILNQSLLNYFLSEKKLFSHIEMLQNYLCLQNGYFALSFSRSLVEEASKRNLKSSQNVVHSLGRLSDLLGEAVALSLGENDEEFTSNLALTLHTKEVAKGSVGGLESPLCDVLNVVKLCYRVDWPLNVIITDEILQGFEQIFMFLMRLERSEILLQKLFLALKSAAFDVSLARYVFPLQLYRSRFLHFVRTTRTYVNVTVIQTTWTEFLEAFDKADDLNEIYLQLVRYVKTVKTNCLLGPKAEGLLKHLNSQLILVEAFCCEVDSLTKDDSNIEQKFKKLTKMFKAFETITKLFVDSLYKVSAKGYYPKISFFLEMYNLQGGETQS